MPIFCEDFPGATHGAQRMTGLNSFRVKTDSNTGVVWASSLGIPASPGSLGHIHQPHLLQVTYSGTPVNT